MSDYFTPNASQRIRDLEREVERLRAETHDHAAYQRIRELEGALDEALRANRADRADAEKWRAHCKAEGSK